MTQTLNGLKPIAKLGNVPRTSSLRNPLQKYPRMIIGQDLQEPAIERTRDGVLRSTHSNTRWLAQNGDYLGTRTNVNPHLSPKTDQRTLIWKDQLDGKQHVLSAEQPSMYQGNDPRKNLLALLTEDIHKPLKQFVGENYNMNLV
jgi:hypothetical protein